MSTWLLTVSLRALERLVEGGMFGDDVPRGVRSIWHTSMELVYCRSKES